MKHFLSLMFLFFLSHIYGQSGTLELECSANAGGDKIICFTDDMILSTNSNQTYANPPGIQWTYLHGEVPAGSVLITNPHDYTSLVQNQSSSTWPPGDYFFEFCVNCQDLNGDHQQDRPCDTVKITVKPEVTTPVITENDGVEDGHIDACHSTSFEINTAALLPGEDYSVDYFPHDGFLTVTDLNGVVTVQANVLYSGCEYDLVYETTNSGCIKYDTVHIHMSNPYDPDNDGIIRGNIYNCPSCSDTLDLVGGRPGCGTGIWTVIETPPGASCDIFPNASIPGSATAVVSATGNYTFVYTVTGVEPCPSSADTIHCKVVTIHPFDIGPDQAREFCGNLIPKGVYQICVEHLEDTNYHWTSFTPGVTVNPDNTACVEMVLPTDHPTPISLYVKAIRFYIDKDCAGPEPPYLLPLPYTGDPNETADDIRQQLDSEGICYDECYDEVRVYYYGSPVVNITADTVNFLCSNGSESIRLSDYFQVLNNGVGYFGSAMLLNPNPHCPNIPVYVTPGQFFPLNVTNCGGCGQFIYRVQLTSTNPITNLPSNCTTTFNILINIETAQVVTAGTDQIKCPQEIIRLNGNNPFCGAFGTWKRVNCSNLDYYQVTIDSIHNPNSQIFITAPNDTICPPDTLCFVWSFDTQAGNCDLSDTTRIIIRDSCCGNDHIDCLRSIHVQSVCQENQMILRVLDENNLPVDASEYTVHWLPMNIYGNPVTVPASGTVHFIVEVYKVVEGDTVCYLSLMDTARCLPQGCGAKVLEACDSNGNVVLTLVDAVTNQIIPFIQYENIMTWEVFGGGPGDESGTTKPFVNPITIQQNACYSLHYVHYIYPPDARYHAPGYETSICTWDLDITCPDLDCPGACYDTVKFFIAGCGDILDLTLNLSFPPNCQSVCNPNSSAGMLGIFHIEPPYNPVLPSEAQINWENNTHGSYAFGNINTIDYVKVISLEDPNCFFEDDYDPNCPCNTTPANIHCEQPITKYCRPDGSFYYVLGAPQIVWTAVPGAQGYVLEITQCGSSETCSGQSTQMTTSVGTVTYWSIPQYLTCFNIRIRAVMPYCTTPAPWSDPYLYCPQETMCNPVITVCGCCHGERSADNAGLPVRIVSEQELLAFLHDNPGTEYATLQEVLTAAGLTVPSISPEFRVFPNPASNRLVIQPGKGIEGNFSVQITDLLQRNWLDQSFEASQSSTLEIDKLPQGVYFVTIRNAHGDKMLSEKITVVK